MFHSLLQEHMKIGETQKSMNENQDTKFAQIDKDLKAIFSNLDGFNNEMNEMKIIQTKSVAELEEILKDKSRRNLI